MVGDNLHYIRRKDLENDINSTIWIELSIPKSKPLLLASVYRQWSVPKVLNIQNSNSHNNQIERWEKFLKNWDVALKENKQIVVLTDDNMDFGNMVFNNRYCVGKLCELTYNFIFNSNITIHNNKNTFFQKPDRSFL